MNSLLNTETTFCIFDALPFKISNPSFTKWQEEGMQNGMNSNSLKSLTQIELTSGQ